MRWRRGLYAALCAGLAVLVVIGIVTADSTNATHGVQLSAAPLGVNTAPWDGGLTGGSAKGLRPLLAAAGIGMLRYGGGSYADDYGWRNNTSVGNCPQGGPDAVSAELGHGGCATVDSLSFRAFSSQAAAIRARSFVTVNYGTSMPADAAAEVSASKTMRGPGAAQWEIGNETYGCWEADDWLAQPPANYHGYVPSGQTGSVNGTCPQKARGSASGTQTLADSYAANARPFMTAMKGADPGAKIGVPWAFGADVPGAAVPDHAAWNDTVLSADAPDISFVDAHYYPFTFSGGTLGGGANGTPGAGIPSDGQILRSLFHIPALYAQIRSTLDTYDPSAGVVVGETNVSSGQTIAGCTHVGGLFAAGDVLSWLAAGAQSVDWWDMDSYGDTGGGCSNPDFGMFTSPSAPGVDDQVPESPFYGYELASVLARPGAVLATLPTSDSADVLAFVSGRPDGRTAVAFLNTDTSAAKTVTFRVPAGLADASGGMLRTMRYSTANSTVVTGTEPARAVTGGAAGGSVTLPAESMTVLETMG